MRLHISISELVKMFYTTQPPLLVLGMCFYGWILVPLQVWAFVTPSQKALTTPQSWLAQRPGSTARCLQGGKSSSGCPRAALSSLSSTPRALLKPQTASPPRTTPVAVSLPRSWSSTTPLSDSGRIECSIQQPSENNFAFLSVQGVYGRQQKAVLLCFT